VAGSGIHGKNGNISETVQVRDTVLHTTSRKLYVAYRIASLLTFE